MLFSNTTQLEDRFSGANPYNLGSIRANAEELFGPVKWRWFLPVKDTRRISDGYHYFVMENV
jgi:hypothetical protein